MAPQIEVRTRVPYTQIPNALIRDKRLRLQTRAVLILMLSLPPDWDYSVRGMASVAGVSKDTMGRILGELEEAGYLRRKEQERGEGGQFGKAGFILTDDPTALFEDEAGTSEEPCPENADTGAPCPNLPCPDKPCPEKSPQQIKEEQTKDLIIPPIVPRRGTPEMAMFERFWLAYPASRHVHKDRAARAWKKLNPDMALCQRMSAALEAQKRSPQWTKDGGEYIPHPSTWLNGRYWEAESPAPPKASGEEDPWDDVH